MYYDDYWQEPNEFEIMVEELKDQLRASVAHEIKQQIETLEKEVKELTEFKVDRDKVVREYESKVVEAQREVSNIQRKLKESEEKWKKARLHELLGDYLTTGWRVGYKIIYEEKCDKCDKDRYIHFTSPQGNPCKEKCACAKYRMEYYPVEEELMKMYVEKTKYPYGDEIDYKGRYYTVSHNDEYDIFDSAAEVYATLDDVDFERINSYNAVFLNEEDCKTYCKWKNGDMFFVKKVNHGADN